MPDPVVKYLSRYAMKSPQTVHWPEPSEALKLSVVIPAMAERDFLPAVIESLAVGLTEPDRVEVIVVVNQPLGAGSAIDENNQKTLAWLRRSRWPFRVLVLDRATGQAAFPADAAGVGVARKLGMDVALERLSRVNRGKRSFIASLDADSPVSKGYIDALIEAGSTQPWVAAVCRYRHPIPHDPELAAAIIRYEAWCRYMEYGLAVAGSPYAYASLGSCIVVTALGYAKVRGMPRRLAGEDFYMLQKLAKISPQGMGRIDTVTVFPAARASKRVPFGTGPAILDCLGDRGGRYGEVVPPTAFFELRHLFNTLRDLFDQDRGLGDLDAPLRAFLHDRKAGEVLPRLRRHAKDGAGFIRAFHGWFDGLGTLQYARSRGALPIVEGVAGLACDQGLHFDATAGALSLLEWLRQATDSQG